MIIIGRDKLDKFARKHSQARKSLAEWLVKAENARWKSSADINATFGYVDHPGPEHIFNIGGNSFRLVAVVYIKNGVIIIDRIMTHTEYDKWNKRKK